MWVPSADLISQAPEPYLTLFFFPEPSEPRVSQAPEPYLTLFFFSGTLGAQSFTSPGTLSYTIFFSPEPSEP